jgi:hypothetical protein
MHQLYFVPKIIINRDGNKRVIQADTEVKLQLINNALRELLGTFYRDSYLDDHLADAIDSIDQLLAHFGDPGDSFGEPPVTLNEMHTAAWQQHQEMHS